MKNLFLYQNVMSKSFPRRNGIYRFKDSDLVGIDVNVVDNADRRNIVTNLKLRDLFIIQPWFRYLLSQAAKLSIVITKVNLRRQLDDGDYNTLENLIFRRDNVGLVSFLRELNYDGDYDIESVSFVFMGYPFTITADGVLETFLDDPQFVNVLAYAEVWNVIAGSYADDQEN